MPLSLKSIQKQMNDDRIMVCFESYSRDVDGAFLTHSVGDRCRAADLDKADMIHFKVDGSPDPVAPYVAPPVDDSPHAKILEPLPDSELVVCTSTFHSEFEGHMVLVNQGDRVDRKSRVVKAFKGNFAPVTS